ncbi:AraC family transcriptional regulator [Kiloniella sp.]|uniref:AraC family transcriptional regulator n=1 Tax=Kiloniella sp. TaxID=1938587 RepID=UPI003A8EB4BA
MNLNIQIETHETMHVAYIHHQGDYNDLEPVFDRLYERAAEAAISLDDKTEIFMLTYDDPNITESRYLRADIGVVIPDVASKIGDLKVQTISAGKYAVAHFKGVYGDLNQAYDWLYGRWLPDSGHEVDDRPAIEIYHNDPAKVLEKDLLTEIRIPLVIS